MKTLKSMLAIALFAIASACALEASAQDNEQRVMKRDKSDLEKDLYKKSDKNVRKEAKQLKKEGWKAMDLSIEKQLEKTWEYRWEDGPDGYPKYVSATTQAVGESFTAAQSQAENLAKLRIASNIGSSVTSLVTIAEGNQQLSPSQAASMSRSVENAKVAVAQKLGRLIVPMTLYRQKKNVYEVRVTVMYDLNSAMKVAYSEIYKDLETGVLEGKEQIESVVGVDQMKEQYSKMNFDE